MARFGVVDENDDFTRLTMVGEPSVHRTDTSLQTTVALMEGGELVVLFHERYIDFSLSGKRSHDTHLAVLFEWADGLSTLVEVTPEQLKYQFEGFDYAVQIMNGVAARAANGVKLVARENSLRLMMAQ
jgi:hypothetical protein